MVEKDVEFLVSVLKAYHFRDLGGVYTVEFSVSATTSEVDIIDQILNGLSNARKNHNPIKVFIPSDFTLPMLTMSDPTSEFINKFYRGKRNGTCY